MNQTCIQKSTCMKDILDIYLISTREYVIITKFDYHDPIDYFGSSLVFSKSNQVTRTEQSLLFDIVYLPRIHRFMIKTHDTIFIVNKEGMNMVSETGLQSVHTAITTEELIDNMVYDCNTFDAFAFNATEEVMFYMNNHHLYFAQTIPPYHLKFVHMFPNDSFRIYRIHYDDDTLKLRVYCNNINYEFSLY